MAQKIIGKSKSVNPDEIVEEVAKKVRQGKRAVKKAVSKIKAKAKGAAKTATKKARGATARRGSGTRAPTKSTRRDSDDVRVSR